LASTLGKVTFFVYLEKIKATSFSDTFWSK
jgi:hypothetical protein